MPKRASDALLTCTVRPTPNRQEQQLDEVRQRVVDGAVLWDVNVTEYSERFMSQPDPSDKESAPEPDPWIEADFTVRQLDGLLVVVRWSITGSEVVSTRKSRIPLQAYARAALSAVEDALELNAEHTYKHMVVERRSHSSTFEMSNGRLIDPRTREQRKPVHRPTRAGASNDKRTALEPARAADEYRQAVARGSRSPTMDVARAFNVGRSTAARALAAAREQGLLGHALRNRAGEQRANGNGRGG